MNTIPHNPHPGHILKTEFLDELKLTQCALARAISVSPNTIYAITHGRQHVSADIDLRLCKYFGLSEGFFMRLQVAHEILKAKKQSQRALSDIKPYSARRSLS